MLSSEESLAAMVETTAVQSLQVSAVARASRAEVKMNAFMVEVNIIVSYSYMVSLMKPHQEVLMLITFISEDC